MKLTKFGLGELFVADFPATSHQITLYGFRYLFANVFCESGAAEGNRDRAGLGSMEGRNFV
jgi:hypothetical protein